MKKSALLLLTIFLLTSPEVFAQEETVGVPAVASPETPVTNAAPKNLFEAIPNLRWDPAVQGTLLMVAPQIITPPKPDQQTENEDDEAEVKKPLPAPIPPGLVSGVYRTPELLDYFGCRQVRLRGLTVFAPSTMVVLNTKLGKPDLYEKLGMEKRLQFLQATLTLEQWKQIGSPQGIGRGDLQGEQRELFDNLFPISFGYQIGTVGSILEESGETRVTKKPERRMFTAAQRSGIRLRMVRETLLFLPSANPGRPYNVGFLSKEAPGTPRLQVYEHFPRNPRAFYGQVLSETVPSRLKIGQIDFDAPALNPAVLIDGAATVGDLIDRVRAVTRVEIYADRRLARLPLIIRAVPNTPLRAGEVLKALCWGVTGAVRNVRSSDTNTAGNVFILTDDVEGLGSRFGFVSEWSMAVSNAQYSLVERLQKTIRKRNAIGNLKLDANDAIPLSAEQAAQIEKGWDNSQSRFLGVNFPLSMLPQELQEHARQSALELNTERAKKSDGREVQKVSDASINISVQVGLRLEVPGVGVIPTTLFMDGGLDALLPEAERVDPNKVPAKTISLPPSLKMGGILSITPADEDEARQAIRIARQYHLKQVWVGADSNKEDASSDTNDTQFLRILAAAIREGKAEGSEPISVLAVARVLTVPPQQDTAVKQKLFLDWSIKQQLPSTAVRDRLAQARVIGEDLWGYTELVKKTRDWLQPDAPGVTKRITNRLSELAAIPGLSGIVLTDILAPGYRSVPNDSYEFSYTSLGYTPEKRIAAIRNFGCDPVDIELDRGYISYDTPGPFLFEATTQQALRKFIKKSPESQKALANAAEKGDLSAMAESNPLKAWATMRFRYAQGLVQQVYQSLALKKTATFSLYLQEIGGGDSGAWFGTWDQQDKLPSELRNTPNESFAQLLERSAHAASKTVLYRQAFTPDENPSESPDPTARPPLSPAEKFAQSFNIRYERSGKTWDGYVFDLRNIPWSKAQEVLEALAPLSTSKK
jgi:hypothetical protein